VQILQRIEGFQVMPNRILREGILTSPNVAKLGWAEEVFYRRLMSVVDDFGRYFGDHGMLRAACYPRQLNKVSDSDVGKWLHGVAVAGLVRVYPAQDGENYIELAKFGQQVRAKKSKFPDPIANDINCQQEQSNAHLDVSVSVSVSDKSASADLFSRFWEAYPKKKAKDDARKAFDKRKPDESLLARMLAAISAQRVSADWQEQEGKFIPHPATWLNDGRWQDEGTEIHTPEPKGRDPELLRLDEHAKRATPIPANIRAQIATLTNMGLKA
jgi:hypothetical protein